MAVILDRGFNAAVLHIASRLFPTGFDVGPDAPHSYDDLKSHVVKTGRMLVWDGASDRTIFGDPEVNYAFRAWHDHCHLAGEFPFTQEGESRAVTLQIEQIRSLYGRNAVTDRWAMVLDCEINGQSAHFAETGEFPEDGLAFALSYLERANFSVAA